MNSIVEKENMTPCGYYDILGCSGFNNTKYIICMTANGDNNFIDEDLITAVKVNKNLVLNFNGLKAESNNIVKETIPELFERNWTRAQ